MKKILTMLFLISCYLIPFLSCAQTGQAEAYIPKTTPYVFQNDLFNQLEFFDDNYIILVDAKKGEACVEAGMTDGDELVVPDSVSYQGKVYPTTAFISYTKEDYITITQKYKTLTLPECIKVVDLHNCPNLQTINIPKDVSSISLRTKQKVHYLIPNEMTNYYLRNNALYSKKETDKLCHTMNIPEKYRIDEGTAYLDGHSFYNTNRFYIREVFFPASVKEIGANIFCYCDNLKKVDMSKCQLSKLSYGSFARTCKLEKVNFPENLKSIDKQAFLGSGISKITLPSKVSIIKSEAFKNCKKLKKFTLEGTKKMPVFKKGAFQNAHSGIKFYVRNRKMAKQLKKRLKESKVKKAKIYAGKKKKLIYKNING